MTTDGTSALHYLQGAEQEQMDMLLGAIAATAELVAVIAASAAKPEDEVHVLDAVAGSVPAIVNTAMDRAVAAVLVRGLSIEGEDSHEHFKRDNEHHISALVHRAGERFRGNKK